MSEEENRFYFSKKDITFYGYTEKEKKLNEQLFDDSLLIAQKDDEIKDLQNQLQQKENIIKEVNGYIESDKFYNIFYCCEERDKVKKEIKQILDKGE